MTEWTLVEANAAGSAPVTHFYRSDAGHFALVSMLNFVTARGTEVYLARWDKAILDPATGEVADNVIAMLALPDGTTFDEALALIDVSVLPAPPAEPEPAPQFHLGCKVATRVDLPGAAAPLAVWALERSAEYAVWMGADGWAVGPWSDAEAQFGPLEAIPAPS